MMRCSNGPNPPQCCGKEMRLTCRIKRRSGEVSLSYQCVECDGWVFHHPSGVTRIEGNKHANNTGEA